MYHMSIKFYILTTFDVSPNFYYEQLLHLCLLKGNTYIFSVGIVKLISRSGSAQSETTYSYHFPWTLCLEQMVTYGMLILWQRNFALCIGKKGIGTQRLKVEVAAMGKTRVENDRGAGCEEGEMMNDISSTTCAYLCWYQSGQDRWYVVNT